METPCCCQAVPKSWWCFIQAIKSNLWTSIIHQEKTPALLIIQHWWRWRYLSEIIQCFHREADHLHSSGSRTEGLPGGPALSSACWHQLGFTKTLIVHLEGGSYPGTADRFALPVGIWIISARIWVFIWGLGRGMLTSPVSDTEKALFAERKPLCYSTLRVTTSEGGWWGEAR